jgi:Protein of unknown function (DUF3558)
MKAMLRSFLTAALFLSMAACNQNQSASTAAAPRAVASATPTAAPEKDSGLSDPCKFLTRGEAESVLGEPVREPEPSRFGEAHICDYKTVAVHGGVLPYSVHIAITPEQPQVWDAGKKLYGKQMRPVPGIGDEAYFLLEDLMVYTHQRSVNINVMKSIDKPDHAKAVEQAERTVAQKAIPRMQGD